MFISQLLQVDDGLRAVLNLKLLTGLLAFEALCPCWQLE